IGEVVGANAQYRRRRAIDRGPLHVEFLRRRRRTNADVAAVEIDRPRCVWRRLPLSPQRRGNGDREQQSPDGIRSAQTIHENLLYRFTGAASRSRPNRWTHFEHEMSRSPLQSAFLVPQKTRTPTYAVRVVGAV